ncbi:MAG TPA: hypothetical protein P5511_09680, partial [Candidatus Goldiibacteriota bacterium]|nr:hypothetical protein [Candidatus Goldiibacteriota bacterium]
AVALVAVFILLFFNVEQKKMEPVKSVKLPGGLKVSIPAGYTVFESVESGVKVYSFTKYTPHRGEKAAFLRIDLFAIPRRATTGKQDQITEVEALNSLVTGYKAELSLKRKRESRKEEGYSSYDVDYSVFKPYSRSLLEIKGRQWNKYVMYDIVEKDGFNILRGWNNYYITFKNNIIIADYLAFLGIDRNGKILFDEYEAVNREIEADAIEILGSITFK